VLGIGAAAVAVLVVALYLRGGSDSLNPVAQAAERTARTPGAKVAMEMSFSVDGSSSPLVANGSGAFNGRTGRTELTMTEAVPGHGSVQIDAVGNERFSYVRSSVLAAELPPGNEWLGMEPFLGHSPQTAFGTNGGAQATIEGLEAVGGGVVKMDQQTVRGHLTTRYKGSIDVAREAQLFGERGEKALQKEFEVLAEKEPAPAPVEVWIDEKGLVRQIRTEQQVGASDGPNVTLEQRMQFYDFGAKPKIKLPPKRRVFDYTPVLRAELGLADGTALGPLAPPAGAKPLAAAEFRKRVNGICRRLQGVARPLVRENKALSMAIEGAGLDSADRARELGYDWGRKVAEPTYRLDGRAIGALVKLAPPAGLASDYRRYLWRGAKEQEVNLAMIRLVMLGAFKSPLLRSLDEEAKASEEKSDRLASKLGISECQSADRGEVGSAQSDLT
jgi:hypothetical protein